MDIFPLYFCNKHCYTNMKLKILENNKLADLHTELLLPFTSSH